MADFRIEKKLSGQGFQAIAGVDEVGRGALFGPVVASAVVFPPAVFIRPPEMWMTEIDDSKAISPVKRTRLARRILFTARAVGIGMCTNQEIDRQNIHRASLEAMKRAVLSLSLNADYLLIDGFGLAMDCPQQNIIRGDRKSISIAAASIMAKVLRDQMMERMDRIYEGYGLARHKGYGTREHFHSIQNKGVTRLHRRSFNLQAGTDKLG